MHSCPECDQACYCGGDIEDHDIGQGMDELCEHDCEDDDSEMDQSLADMERES